MFELVTIPCLNDNYAFLLHHKSTGKTALIDAPEAAPILKALNDRQWQLSEIWLTHHHDDHIDAVPELKAKTGAITIGAKNDSHRLPPLDNALSPAQIYKFCGHDTHIFDVSGHTINHIAFYVPDAKALFTGDSLMALGCGRLFEGSPEQMWQSLSALKSLPSDISICSGHEYTAANARFALTIEPENQDLINRNSWITKQRENNNATVPSTLDDELKTNPFLRADRPEIKRHLDMTSASDAACFAAIRKMKDNF